MWCSGRGMGVTGIGFIAPSDFADCMELGIAGDLLGGEGHESAGVVAVGSGAGDARAPGMPVGGASWCMGRFGLSDPSLPSVCASRSQRLPSLALVAGLPRCHVPLGALVLLPVGWV